MKFKLKSQYHPTGDQPQAIKQLAANFRSGVPHQTLLGVTGSGKSVAHSTIVLVKKSGLVYVRPIGKLIDSLFLVHGDKMRRIKDHEILWTKELSEPYEVFSFNPISKEASWKPVTQFLRHKAPKILFRVQSSCGREVITTSDHNFFVLRDGKFSLRRTASLKKGDFLPLPLSLDEPTDPIRTIPLDRSLVEKKLYVNLPAFQELWKSHETLLRPLLSRPKIHNLIHSQERVSFGLYQQLIGAVPSLSKKARVGVFSRDYQLPPALNLSSQLMRLVGYYIAEGHAEDRYFILSTADQKILDDIKTAARILGLHIKHRPRTYDYQVSSSLWSSILSSWCGKNSSTKQLPPFWPNLSNEHLANLLSAYFSTDGGVDGLAVTATTASKGLASELVYALLRFNIVARTRKKIVRGGVFWIVSVSGNKFLKTFQAKIGFVLSKKRESLNKIVKKTYNTNVDIIPIDGLWLKSTREKLGLFQKEIAKEVGVGRSLISMFEHNRRKPSRETFTKLVVALKNWAGRKRQDLLTDMIRKEGLLNLYWTPIKNVQEVPEEKHVYDLAVKGNETFLAGTGGIFVHNTFTMANAIERRQKPTLVISHNKTLAAQLYQEFKEFFPENAVHYFVSYYDYYQPEAYIPQTDTYIEKDAKINEMIDALRHASTASLLTRDDVIIVASVSCIYGVGDPEEYQKISIELKAGEKLSQEELIKHLVLLQYTRNPIDPGRGHFRTRENVVEVYLPSGQETILVEFDKGRVKTINKRHKILDSASGTLNSFSLFPAKHFVTPHDKLELAIVNIEKELKERLAELKKQRKILEAARLKQRTEFDLEMLRSTGYVNGIENYSRHVDFRESGTPPHTLIDYFRHAHGNDFLTFIDESHATVPQIRGMYNGDRARKWVLIDYGFRLPSALDNRPLKFDEFNKKVGRLVYVSATPSPYEIEKSRPYIIEQLIRPTGILDPQIEIRSTKNQIKDVVKEIKKRVAKKERSLVLALTKRLAEDIAEYLVEAGLKAEYLHSEVKTLERSEVLKKLRTGEHDVIVGINLLREGLDLPEVSFIAVLDADKEGFLRNETTLLQIIGRAARHTNGKVILYADIVTGSMKAALGETERRRKIQEDYNRQHGITPQQIKKAIRESIMAEVKHDEEIHIPEGPRGEIIKSLEREMKKAAREMDFELAARIRDRIRNLTK